MTKQLQILTDLEIDAVAGGQQGAGQIGLVNAAVQINDTLNNNEILKNFLNNNQVDVDIVDDVVVNVNAAVGVLGFALAGQNVG